jgi:hypothetical protein
MNKKPAAENNGRDIRLTTYSIPQTQKNFTYKCSFCWRELPNGGWRVAGFGVCPPHLRLAETIINALRKHHADYRSLGGTK